MIMINFHNVELRKTAYKPGDYPPQLPEIVFVGRSNVGKSSMLNKLLGRKSLARVSASPGKTRSINYYCVDKKMYLTDLPGYGFAKVGFADREKWRLLIDDYFAAGRDIRLVVMLVDIRHAPSKEDRQMVDYLCQLGLDFMICASKSDKLSKTAAQNNCAMIADELDIEANIIPFSSLKGDGVSLLMDIIKERCDVDYGQSEKGN